MMRRRCRACRETKSIGWFPPEGKGRGHVCRLCIRDGQPPVSPDSEEPTLPAEPLVAAVETRGGVGALQHLPATDDETWADRRAYFRAKESGRITVAMADRLCVRLLGIHPSLLWGRGWAVGLRDDPAEPSQPQLPTAPVPQPETFAGRPVRPVIPPWERDAPVQIYVPPWAPPEPPPDLELFRSGRPDPLPPPAPPTGPVRRR